MTDYTSTNHNMFASVSYIPATTLTFTGTINLNKSTGELDLVEMPSVEAKLEGGLSHQDFTFDEMHTYSNLDFTTLQFTLGMEYKLTPTVTLTSDIDYSDLDDKAGYVYGVESGSFFMIRSGIRFDL
ncbi:MAG: hypothetical protein KAR42_07940 [candidate division Zixibacteria bacterium]|nr:hypothetical protein [candidate division Zixibacteria bacterium]